MMKHKAWIKNYENNFEQLAEEIGDLRYDSLADFLQLLATKIQKDGQKDQQRGRAKLAASLFTASDHLLKSSKAITTSWDISEPFMYPIDIREKIKLDFKREDQKEAYQIISNYAKFFEDDVNYRLSRCLVFLAKGSIDQLKLYREMGRRDPRDLMSEAEYDEAMNRLRNFNRPFGQENRIEEDLNTDAPQEDNYGDLPF